MKDLKASGLKPRGADYELREFSSGSWQLLELSDDVAQDATPPEKKLKAAAATVTKLPARAAAKSLPKKAAAKKAADAEAFAKMKRPEPTPEPDAKFGEHIAGGNAGTDPENDLSPLGVDLTQCPLQFRIIGVPDFDAPKTALAFARQLNMLVAIFDKNGKLLRTMDPRIGGSKKQKRASSKPAGGGKRSTEPSGMQAQLIALATRKQGVTRAQIAVEVSDRKLAWTTMIRDCERFGYTYRTTEAAEGSGARVVYHLDKI
jgi:hypothetical protein